MESLWLLFWVAVNPFYNLWLILLESVILGRYLWWWRLRIGLLLFYLHDSPYSVIKREGAQTPVRVENLTYGETPVLSAGKILSRLSPSSEDTLIDLGCGRGQVVFAAHCLFGMEAIGIDIIPTFVSRGARISVWMGTSQKVRFIKENLAWIPDELLQRATIFYLSGTTFDDEQMEKIVARLERARLGTRLITLSEELKSPLYRVEGSDSFDFTWGRSEVYFHRKVG